MTPVYSSLCRSISIALMVLGAACVSAQQCTAPSSSTLHAAALYVAQLSGNIPDDVHLVSSLQWNSGCLWELRYLLGSRQTDATFYLSEDQRYLFPSVHDLSADPKVIKTISGAALSKMLSEHAIASEGDSGGTVTIVEFMDFECPFCAKLAHALETELQSNPRIRIVFRNFPLAMHPWARPAARMGVCASQQGEDVFWRLDHFLLSNQSGFTEDTLTQNVLSTLAASPRFDRAAFTQCLGLIDTDQRVIADVELGRSHGVHATPTFFVNGVLYQGAKTSDQLHEIIAAAEQAAAVQPGTLGKVSIAEHNE